MKLKTITLALSLALATNPCMAATAEQERESAKKLFTIIETTLQKKQQGQQIRTAFLGACCGFLISSGLMASLNIEGLPIQYYGAVAGGVAGAASGIVIGIVEGVLSIMLSQKSHFSFSANELPDEELEKLLVQLKLALQSETTAPKAESAA